MPISPPSLCTNHCGALVYGGGQCPNCLAETRRERDKQRPNAATRGYDSKWREMRDWYLQRHPTCTEPGCIEPATDVDHIDGRGPHGPRGYDPSNLRAYCHAHHSAKTALHDGGFGHATR